MKKTKRMLCLAMSMLLIFALSACGGGGNNANNNASTNNNNAATTNNNTPADSSTPATTTDDGGEDAAASTSEFDFGGVTVKAIKGGFDNLNQPDKTDWIENKERIEQKYNIKIETVNVETTENEDIYDEIIKSVASGSPVAHIGSFGRDYLAKMVLNNVVVPINNVGSLGFASRYTNHANYLGKDWGVAEYNVDAGRPMAYNRGLIEEAGMEYTPTEMFMNGDWDYTAFKNYLVELKSKLPSDMYPLYVHPWHWAIYATAANGSCIVDEEGQLRVLDDAFIEAMEFYQELLADGLIPPATKGDDGAWSFPGSFPSEVAITTMQEWQFDYMEEGLQWGVSQFPWGSNVSAPGDYTSISENYHTAYADGGVLCVLSGASQETGIPEEILLDIAWEVHNVDGRLQYMKNFKAEEDAGNFVYNANVGKARNFQTKEDITVFDWGFSRITFDNGPALNSAGYINVRTVLQNACGEGSSIRAALEAEYPTLKAAMNEIGLTQK